MLQNVHALSAYKVTIRPTYVLDCLSGLISPIGTMWSYGANWSQRSCQLALSAQCGLQVSFEYFYYCFDRILQIFVLCPTGPSVFLFQCYVVIIPQGCQILFCPMGSQLCLSIGQLVPSVMILTRYLCIIQNNAIDAIRLSLYMSRLFMFMSDGPISSVWSISHYLIL